MVNGLAPELSANTILPVDRSDAALVGRVWIDGPTPGPRITAVRDDMLIDLSEITPTMADLLDRSDAVECVKTYKGAILGSIQCFLDKGALLAPCDLQAIKAAGVTFVSSAIERVIEEQCQGRSERAGEIRNTLRTALGNALQEVVPGSLQARDLKKFLTEKQLWSQYLEVAIGPDPEIFTKAQPMSAVGCGADVGVHRQSQWNNPEAEIVLAISSAGSIVGASLGNDVNLRDIESRSALLLGKAKDNNASCAIGPFIRLFDNRFRLDDVRSAEVQVTITGADGFKETGVSSMGDMSRDPVALTEATIGPSHQYPDGLMLFLGTTYTPASDRIKKGGGFTHKIGDAVRIESPKLGALENRVTTSDLAPPWRYGVRELMRSLAARRLL
ncbi:fumarylacetoacetate hydrolase family protein [Hyphococcus luteus]|uniref:Fumarylacetoacetate hydrolase n=1 Tax=Hyphococcus luteus TaxID=2058213 RepID=A0A2S7KA57_9PROT|nr:fumarylacetoacetate hydrolase family protein [Marinicaulis flavus]PQA89404.1 fumarylacetoacetate hydrolase [Marinicaulis flavus]